MLGLIKADLLLFDGDSAGTTGESTAVTQQGNASKPTMQNPNIPWHLLRNKPAGLEDAAKADGVQEGTQQEGEAAKQAKPTYEEMKELYKAEYQKDISSQFGRRMKTANSEIEKLKKSNSQMQDIMNLIGNKYPGVDVTNPEALMQAVKSDESFFRQKAIDNGTSVEEEQFTFAKERELTDAKERLQKYETERAQQQSRQRILQQSKELKAEYPDFDLDVALENAEFRAMLTFTRKAKGVENVKEAYEFAFRNELRDKAIKQTVDKTKEAVSQNRKAKQYMPSPPGATGKTVNSDVSAFHGMSAKEIAQKAKGKNLIDFLK